MAAPARLFVGSFEEDWSGGEAAGGDEGWALDGAAAAGFGVGSAEDAGLAEGSCASAEKAKANARASTENLETQLFMSHAS